MAPEKSWLLEIDIRVTSALALIDRVTSWDSVVETPSLIRSWNPSTGEDGGRNVDPVEPAPPYGQVIVLVILVAVVVSTFSEFLDLTVKV